LQQQGLQQQQWTSTSVLIVGAGPVGLTLAIDLARRGVQCMLVEKQAAPSKLPKMERCNARSMEIYRRLGLAGLDLGLAVLGSVVLGHAFLEGFDALGDVAHQLRDLAAPEQQQHDEEERPQEPGQVTQHAHGSARSGADAVRA